MKLLLDTHAALWFLAGDRQLGENARRHVSDPANEVLLSAVVAWEVAIKRPLGKLEVPAGYLEPLLEAGGVPLAVTVAHAAAVEHLPPHHRDPFDRLLIAEADIEGAALVTRALAIAAYGITVIW